MSEIALSASAERIEYFLRQDSLFIETADGVFLRGAKGESFLKGRTVYRWLVALAPRLAVGSDLAGLCAGLDATRRDMVVRLLDRLRDAGFVELREPEPDGLLPLPVEQRFAEQISFLRHDGERPRERFRQWRAARVLVVGDGPDAASAVLSLLRNGATDITVGGRCGEAAVPAPWDAELAGLAGAGTPARVVPLPAGSVGAPDRGCAGPAPDAVILTPGEGDAEFREDLFSWTRSVGAVFVSAERSGRFLVKGPLVPRKGTSCWGCAREKLARMSHGISSEEIPEIYPAVLAAAGSELALELFRHLAGAEPSGLESALVVQDPLTLTGRREPLPADPRCLHCAEPAAGPPQAVAALTALTEGRLDLPSGSDERYERSDAALAAATGPLHRFDDGAVPQVSVKAGVVRASGPGGASADFAGFHPLSLTDARCAAVERAARWSAAVSPAPAVVVSGTSETLAADGERALPVEEGDGAVTRWTPAVSLVHGGTVWVPAGLVGGGAPADGPPDLSGYGAGATFTDVALEGVLSALLHEALQADDGGRTVPSPAPAVAAPADAAGFAFVHGLARTGRLSVAELPAPGRECRVMTARLARPDRTVTVAAAGTTREEAVRTALLELAGRTQLDDVPYGHPSGDGGRAVSLPPDRPLPDRPLGEGAATGPGSQPAGAGEPEDDRERLARLLSGLRADGRDALLVRTPPADLGGAAAPVLVGRVLLTP
ncbi:YcaO-like family protein [Streptomyces sp. NPDC089799]|uniref:YcaO-like family protein n=1 Tax=Streptomyces sp. NPDC089799 TaxID=3155066 RepID=UPI003414D97B